jgi:hypothetical protein
VSRESTSVNSPPAKSRCFASASSIYTNVIVHLMNMIVITSHFSGEVSRESMSVNSPPARRVNCQYWGGAVSCNRGTPVASLAMTVTRNRGLKFIVTFFFFFITLGLETSDTKVYEP